MSDVDYSEALRLIRKHMQPGDTLGMMFMRVAKALEGESGRERCPTCGHTDLAYSRLVDPWCTIPWHADAHLRRSVAPSNGDRA